MTLIQQLVQKGILDKEKAATLEYEAKTSDKKLEDLILDKNLCRRKFYFV